VFAFEAGINAGRRKLAGRNLLRAQPGTLHEQDWAQPEKHASHRIKSWTHDPSMFRRSKSSRPRDSSTTSQLLSDAAVQQSTSREHYPRTSGSVTAQPVLTS